MDPAILRNAEFQQADEAHWRDLAQKALKGADFEQALVSQTDDGLRIEPVYPRRAEPRLLPRRRPQLPWTIVQRVDDPDPARAAAQIGDEVANGAGGLALVFEGAPNAHGYGIPLDADVVAALLADVPLDRVHLRIDVHPASRQSLDWVAAALARKRIAPEQLSLSFGIDPAALFAGTGRLRMSIEALKASMPQSLAHFFAMQVPGVLLEADGRVYHNGGATEALELGAMLSSAVTHLRMFEEARQPLVYAAPHIGFALAVDQNQFLSMAKIRALRLLWARVQECCAIDASPATIHAETSWRMMTRLDPETNILRNTIAALAAAAGGADSVSVLPHTIAHGLPDGFARRLARNTQLILRDESALGFVGDPAAGSGSIEALTDLLCDAAWTEFTRIEADGGILDSLRDGKFQDRVRQARSARANGNRTIIGTTLYPAADERPVTTLAAPNRPMPTDGTAHCEPLQAQRDDEMTGVAA